MSVWPKIKLNEVAEVKHGFAFKSSFFSDNGHYVLLTPGNFNESGGFRWLGEKQKYYSGNIPQEYILEKDDLLVAMTEQAPGLLGCAILIPESNKYLHNQRLGLVKLKNRNISKLFLFHVFNSRLVRKPISETSGGTKVKHTSPDKIGDLSIPFLPMDQQKIIAEILSTWDTAIVRTSKLISAKKNKKKALMHQLLEGKKRLPSFKDSWKEYYLKDLFSERKETNGGHLPLLAITGKQGIILASEIDRKDSSSEDKSRYKKITPGDIGYNTMRMWQGVSAVSDMEGIVSPAYTICKPKKGVDVIFMGHLFKMPSVVHLFWRFSQGLVNDTLNLKFHHFAQIKIKIPEIKEQIAIAKVLTTIDNEIKYLKKKMAAMEKQKRGLMQKLLTGEVRVKV